MLESNLLKATADFFSSGNQSRFDKDLQRDLYHSKFCNQVMLCVVRGEFLFNYKKPKTEKVLLVFEGQLLSADI